MASSDMTAFMLQMMKQMQEQQITADERQRHFMAAILDRRAGQFNDWERRGCNKFDPVLGGNGTKIAPTGDIFDQPPSQMR